MRQCLLLGVELAVDEDAAMISEVDLMEVIHVELPDEGGEAVVAEVFGEYDFLQFLLVEDPNAPGLSVPIDDLGVFL